MTPTLNLFGRLLARARTLRRLGQTSQAVSLLRRLAGFRDLPAEVAEEVHSRLGVLLLRQRRFAAARRHLAVAARYNPGRARYHYLMGLACRRDPAGDAERALRHYRRSLRLAPGQVRCLGEAGLLAVRLGETDRGIAWLRRAAELAPDDPGAVARLARGWQQAGRPDEALRAVRLALFRSPRCRRLRRLWADLRLAGLRREQETAGARGDEEGPVLLHFLRLVETPPREVRHDGAAALPGPHLVRLRPRLVSGSRRRAP